jgi:hypothetical protein
MKILGMAVACALLCFTLDRLGYEHPLSPIFLSLALGRIGEPVINAMSDCGLKGDGKTDNNGPFAYCMALVDDSGLPMFIPPGIYLINPSSSAKASGALRR